MTDAMRERAEEVLSAGYYRSGEPEGGNPFIASHIALAKDVLALLADLKEIQERLDEAVQAYWQDDPFLAHMDAARDLIEARLGGTSDV